MEQVWGSNGFRPTENKLQFTLTNSGGDQNVGFILSDNYRQLGLTTDQEKQAITFKNPETGFMVFDY